MLSDVKKIHIQTPNHCVSCPLIGYIVDDHSNYVLNNGIGIGHWQN